MNCTIKTQLHPEGKKYTNLQDMLDDGVMFNYESVKDMVKLMQSQFKNKEVNISDGTPKQQHLWQKLSEGKDTLVRYWDDVKQRYITSRVSDVQKLRFNRNKSLEEIKSQNLSKKSKGQRESGTFFHNIMEKLWLDETLNGIESNNPHLSKLVQLKKDLENKIDELATKKDGTKLKYDIIPELTLFDKESDTAGTADLVVIFEDGSYAIYDYKFIDLLDGTGALAKEISPVKIQVYDSQISPYKKMLSNLFDVTHARQTRIVPIAVHANNRGEFVHMDVNQDPIAVAKELTDNDSINKALNKLYNERDRLSGKKEFKQRVKQINDSIQELLVKQRLNGVIENIEYINKITEDKLDSLTYMNVNDYYDIADVYEFTLDHTYELLDGNEDVYNSALHSLKLIKAKLKAKKLELLKTDANNLDTSEDLTRPDRKVDWIGKWLKSLSKHNHPIVQLVNRLIENSNASKRSKLDKIEADLQDIALDDYSNLLNSLGNLKNKFNSDYYKKRKEIRKKNKWTEEDIKWLKDNVPFDKERYELKKKELAQSLKDSIADSDVRQRILLEWIDKNNRTIKGNNVLSPLAWRSGNLSFVLDPSDEFLSDEYLELSNDERTFYDYFYKTMQEYRKYLIDKEGIRLNKNFTPFIKESMLERGFSFKGVGESFVNSLIAYEGDDTLGMIDPETGRVIDELPLYYINPKSLGGESKSKELAHSLFLFSAMMINHQENSEVEPIIKTARSIYASLDSLNKDDTINPDNQDNLKLLDDYLSTMFYGRRFINKDFKIKLPKFLQNPVKKYLGIDDEKEVEFSAQKTVSEILQYTSKKNVGFNPITSTVNLFAVNTNRFIIGAEGRYFTNLQFKQSTMDYVNGEPKYVALLKLFDVSSDKYWKGNKLKKGNIMKEYENDIMSLPYLLMNRPERSIQNGVLGAMLRNYTVTEDGRIERKSKDDNSILDQIEYQDDLLLLNGKSIKEAIKVEEFYKFRRIAEKVMGSISGKVSHDDKLLYQNTLWGMVVGQYRNWIPNIVGSRVKNLEIDKTTGEIDQGRYRVAYNEIFNNFSKSVMSNAGGSMNTLGKLLIEGVSLGYFKTIDDGKVNKSMLNYYYRNEIDRLKKISGVTSDNELKNMGLWFNISDYKDMYFAKLRGTARELGITLYLVMSIFGLAAAFDDDDDKKNLKHVNNILDRVLRELMFVYNPKEAIELFANPLALMRDIKDLSKFVENTGDEARDSFFGENQSNDKSSIGHYFMKLIPILNQWIKLVELDRDTLREITPRKDEKGLQLVD